MPTLTHLNNHPLNPFDRCHLLDALVLCLPLSLLPYPAVLSRYQSLNYTSATLSDYIHGMLLQKQINQQHKQEEEEEGDGLKEGESAVDGAKMVEDVMRMVPQRDLKLVRNQRIVAQYVEGISILPR